MDEPSFTRALAPLWLAGTMNKSASKCERQMNAAGFNHAAKSSIIRSLMTQTTNVNASEVSVAENQNGGMDIQQILSVLPHRYPFLLIDRIVAIDRKKKIAALKNVTINEPYFAGHFPERPIMPGVLLVEAMAQAGAVLLLTEFPDRNQKLVFFTGIERARFRRPVIPGDQLRIEVEVLSWRRIAGRMDGKVLVDGKLAAEAIISCAVVDRPSPTGQPQAGETESPE
jgi:3-hydroxyacyl-[acyl-carrier-protein] dehydratase